jgi:hypothetical protein
MNDRITDPITERLGKTSDDLANANGLHGYDSFLRNSNGEPLELGAAGNNAIAHALSSAYLAFDHSPAVASVLGWLREYNSYWHGQDPAYAWDTFKDLYNNQVGRNIADYVRSNNLSRDQIQDLVLDALTTGKLIVTHEDKRIDPSFDGNPWHFALPDEGAPPWTGPSAGFSDFAPTVTRVPIAPPLAPSPLQGSPPPMSAFWPHAENSPAGDSFGNSPRMSGNPAAISPSSFMGISSGATNLQGANGNPIQGIGQMAQRSSNVPAQAESDGPIGIFSGKPMPRWPVPPPIFDTRDNSNVAGGNWLTSALLRGSRISQPPSLDTNGSQVPLAPNGQESATAAPSDPGDAFDPLASPSRNSEGPLSLNDAYVEYLKRLNANQSPASVFEPSAPAPPRNGLPTPQPPEDDGPLTLMEAYQQYRKRIDASQPQALAFDAGAPAAPLAPSDDSNFSGGLVGRLTALMRQYPDVYGPPPPEDDEMPSYYGLMLNR